MPCRFSLRIPGWDPVGIITSPKRRSVSRFLSLKARCYFDAVDNPALLYALNVLSLWSLVALCHNKTDGLAVSQAAATAAPDGAKVDEDFFAIVFGDKAKALGYIEPLDRSVFTRPVGDSCSCLGFRLFFGGAQFVVWPGLPLTAQRALVLKPAER